LKALLIDFSRIDGKKRVELRDNTLVDPIIKQTRGQKGIVGQMELRKQCVLTRRVGRGFKPQDVHSHHPEAALKLKMYIAIIQMPP
jgi:hypothetical protein